MAPSVQWSANRPIDFFVHSGVRIGPVYRVSRVSRVRVRFSNVLRVRVEG